MNFRDIVVGQEVGVTGRYSYDPTRLGTVTRIMKSSLEVHVPAQLGLRAQTIKYASTRREWGHSDSMFASYLIDAQEARERMTREASGHQRRLTTATRRNLIQSLTHAIADDDKFSDVLKELVMTLPTKQKGEE